MKSHGIELILISRRHVHQSFPCSTGVFHTELNSGLKIECFDEGSFFECLGVANCLHLNTLTVTANAQLGMLPNTIFNDVSNVLETWRQLLHFIVAKRDVVSNVALVTGLRKSFLEFIFGLFIFFFFVEDAALCNSGLGGVWRHLGDK